MSAIQPMNDNEFALWRDYLEKMCGIHIAAHKAYLFTGKLMNLLKDNACKTFSELLMKVKADKTGKLETQIIEFMTTNETLWFRDGKPFSIMQDVIFKEFADNIRQGKKDKIKIWCAASSYGQEPYSIAILFQEMKSKGLFNFPDKVEIIATDISETVLYHATQGKYDVISMSRGMPPDLKAKYFDGDGKYWTLKENIRKMIKFQKLNLKNPFSNLGNQDLILCRNVCIYFSEELKKT
ncbi:MAG: hypothetical protein ACD_79C00418G0001, partial [uncultured bacterium]